MNGVLERHWSMREAAPLLGVSERQIILDGQSKGQTRAEATRTYHRSQFMEGLTLSTKEQSRLHILNGVLERHCRLCGRPLRFWE